MTQPPPDPDATPPLPEAMLGLALLVWLVLAIRAVWRQRALTRQAFVGAPLRPGRMGLHDLAITAGLVVLGPTFLASAVGGGFRGDSMAQLMLRQMLLSQIGALPAIAYIFWRADTAVSGGIAGLGLRPREIPRSLRLAVQSFMVIYPITLCISAIVTGILRMLGHSPPLIAHEALQQLAREGLGGAAGWGLAFSAVVIAPVIEEIIFRGMLQSSLLQSGLVVSRWTAIVCSAVPFALIHGSVAPPHAWPALYALAVGLGWAYERWGSLWVPIFIHAIFNAVNIVLAMNVDRLVPS